MPRATELCGTTQMYDVALRLNALLDCDLEDEMCFHVWVSAVI